MLPIGTGRSLSPGPAERGPVGRCDEKLAPLITRHSFPVQMLYGSKAH
jgi:hypothetical protein